MTTMTAMTTSPPTAHGQELQETISEAMVELYNQHFPAPVSMAETFLNKDLVCCVLEGIFDAHEQERIERGDEQAVLDERHALQQQVRPQLVAAVEHATERRVVAFMSANHGDPALAAELFVLEPR